MSEQISEELLKAMNDMTDNETMASKIDASVFVRESEEKVNEKVAYLYNMLKIEAKNCSQKEDRYFEDVNMIITHYKQKLHMVYDEYYCQYANIQSELQEANANRKIAMINYQKIVNKIEEGAPQASFIEQKNDIKRKNALYKNIINMCNDEFASSKDKFEAMINNDFKIMSKSLQLVSEQNIFQRAFSKFANIFNGSQKYQNILKDYHKMVNDIDSYEIVGNMRDDTVEFVADILEKRGIEGNELEEEARIGGRKCLKLPNSKLKTV